METDEDGGDGVGACDGDDGGVMNVVDRGQPCARWHHDHAHADDGHDDGRNIDCLIHLLVPKFYSVTCNRPKVCAYVLVVCADMWQANYEIGDFEPSLAFVLNSKLLMPQVYLSNLAAIKLCF